MATSFLWKLRQSYPKYLRPTTVFGIICSRASAGQTLMEFH